MSEQPDLPPRTRVAVLYGGRSSEHPVSVVTAASVLGALDRGRYDVVPIGIGTDGRWVLTPEGAVVELDGSSSAPGTAEPVVLSADPTADRGRLAGVDVVLPLLHGPFGEDGTVQGLLELAGIPYVGSGVFASAAAMDKHHMKRLLASAGLDVPDYVVVRAGQGLPVQVEDLGLPVFVKPARGGSSLGISRVDRREDLDAALALAYQYDPKALIETAVLGREIECGVLAGADGAFEASLPAEVLTPDDHAFYDFHAKYVADTTRFEIPPDLPEHVVERIRSTAVTAAESLDCEGLARVDFFLTRFGELVVNEVNTMPGFTPQSMFPRMWAATGVDYPAVLDRLIADALRRGTGLR